MWIKYSNTIISSAVSIRNFIDLFDVPWNALESPAHSLKPSSNSRDDIIDPVGCQHEGRGLCSKFWVGLLFKMESGYQLKVDPLPALFSCDKETDSSSDASASDKEWRDAIKAAVENEIQYQVQLRLALDGISEQDIEKQEDAEAVQLLELRARKRTRCSRKSTDQLASQDPMITDGIRFEGQQQQQKQQPDESLDTTTSLKPQLYAKKDNQTIYDYLYSKYGTPYDQLKHLMQNGRFLSPSEKVRAEVSIDQRVRWPVECNIIQPTPQLSTHQIQPKMPMQSFGPLLGQVRPSFHHATSFPVYDCKEEIELCTSELTFESRFESGNLRQAMQV